MTVQEKLNSLTENSVWSFTKQSTDFDDAFRATKLFKDAYLADVNLEEYFSNHYLNYGISTSRHRIWIISQLFGLITKTPFYHRGNGYLNEKPTAIFDLLNQHEIGSESYNTLKSEQLIKVKIKAVIDSNVSEYNQVLSPLLYSYMVLRELDDKYGIKEITTDQYYTYVATSNDFSEIEETAYLLSQNPQISNFTELYKDRSRIKPLLEKNTNLFDFSDNKIKINPIYNDYFQNRFVSKIDLNEITTILNDPNAYAYYLYNSQNYNVNLIDSPSDYSNESENTTTKISILETTIGEDKYDADYVDLVDEIKEENINNDIADGAYRLEPRFANTREGLKVIKNPIFGKIAIQNSNYQCNVDPAHTTFISKVTGRNFMEAHHLVPMKNAQEVYQSQNINIDCVENLVSLCPNCHRAVHYGSSSVRKDFITLLYNKKISDFNSIGLNIEIVDLIKMY